MAYSFDDTPYVGVKQDNLDEAPSESKVWSKDKEWAKLKSLYKGDFESLRSALEADENYVPKSLKGDSNRTKRNKFNTFKAAIVELSNADEPEDIINASESKSGHNPYLSRLASGLAKSNWKKDAGVTSPVAKAMSYPFPNTVEGIISEDESAAFTPLNILHDVSTIPTRLGTATINQFKRGSSMDEFLDDVGAPNKYRTGPEKMADDIFSGYAGGKALKGIGKVVTSPKLARALGGKAANLGTAAQDVSKGRKAYNAVGKFVRPEMEESVAKQISGLGRTTSPSFKRGAVEGVLDAALPTAMEAKDADSKTEGALISAAGLLGGGIGGGIANKFLKGPGRSKFADELFPDNTSPLASKVKKDEIADAMRFHGDFPKDPDAAEKSIAGIGRIMDEDLDLVGKNFRSNATEGLDKLSVQATEGLPEAKDAFIQEYTNSVKKISSEVPFSDSGFSSFMNESKRSLNRLKDADPATFHNDLVKEATRLGKLTGKGGDEYKELYKLFKGNLLNTYPDILTNTVQPPNVGVRMGDIGRGNLTKSYDEFSKVYDEFKPFSDLGVRGKQLADLDLKGLKKVGSFANEAGQSGVNPLGKATLNEHVKLVKIVSKAKDDVVKNLTSELSKVPKGSVEEAALSKRIVDISNVDPDYLTQSVKANIANSGAGSTTTSAWTKESVVDKVKEQLTGVGENFVRGEGALNKGAVNLPASSAQAKRKTQESDEELSISDVALNNYKVAVVKYLALPGDTLRANKAWLRKPKNKTILKETIFGDDGTVSDSASVDEIMREMSYEINELNN